MDSKYSVSNIASIAPKMDSRVLKAYKKLGFTVTLDPSVNYGGCFNAHSRSIILRFENETIYHSAEEIPDEASYYSLFIVKEKK